MRTIEEIVSVLNEEQRQLLKDTIRHGYWGDCEYGFIDENGEVETVYADGFCTNDAKNAGHFSGRKVSAMFRAIYHKICDAKYSYTVGAVISHANDWWGDGTGDMLFIRGEYTEMFENWAKQ